MNSNKKWDCTKPGENPLDELHRALYDLARLVKAFEQIALDWVRAQDDPDDEKAVRCKQLIDQTRLCWAEWVIALPRAHRALTVDLKCFDLDTREVHESLGALYSIFKPPTVSLVHETEGDHLILRSAGPLTYYRNNGSNFPFGKVSSALEPVGILSDTVWSLAGTDLEGRLKHTGPSDLRPARWFTSATRGTLSGDTLRKAVKRNALIHSTQSESGKEWRHSIKEVCEVYRQHEPKILDALEKE